MNEPKDIGDEKEKEIKNIGSIDADDEKSSSKEQVLKKRFESTGKSSSEQKRGGLLGSTGTRSRNLKFLGDNPFHR